MNVIISRLYLDFFFLSNLFLLILFTNFTRRKMNQWYTVQKTIIIVRHNSSSLEVIN